MNTFGKVPHSDFNESFANPLGRYAEGRLDIPQVQSRGRRFTVLTASTPAAKETVISDQDARDICKCAEQWIEFAESLQETCPARMEHLDLDKVSRGLDQLVKIYKKQVEDHLQSSVNALASMALALGGSADLPLPEQICLQNLVTLRERVDRLKQQPARYVPVDAGHTEALSQSFQDQLDAKLVGHVVGGFMVGADRDLEGSTQEIVMRFMNTFLDLCETELPDEVLELLPPHSLSKLRREISTAQQIDQGLDALRSFVQESSLSQGKPYGLSKANEEAYVRKFMEDQRRFNGQKQAFIGDILERLRRLEEGETLLMPAGWTASAGETGHAVLYRFTKQGQKLQMDVINTGAGTETHMHQLQGTKVKMLPIRRFSGLELREGQVDALFLESLVERQVLAEGSPITPYGADDIYVRELLRFKGFEKKVSPDEVQAITGQRSGVCAYKSLVISMRLSLGTDAYKVLKHFLEMRALRVATSKLENHGFPGPLEHKILHVLERACHKQAKAVWKLRQKGLVSTDLAQQVNRDIPALLTQLKRFRKSPAIPSPGAAVAAFSSVGLTEQIVRTRASLKASISVAPTEPRLTLSPSSLSPSSLKAPEDPADFVHALTEMTQEVATLSRVDQMKSDDSSHIPYGAVHRTKTLYWRASLFKDQDRDLAATMLTETWNAFGYAGHEQLWSRIAEDPSLLEQVWQQVAVLSKAAHCLASLGDRRHSTPKEMEALCQFYTLLAFLVHRQSLSDSAWQGCFIDDGGFGRLAKSYILPEQLGSSFHQNLAHLTQDWQGQKTRCLGQWNLPIKKSQEDTYVDERGYFDSRKQDETFSDRQDLLLLERMLELNPVWQQRLESMYANEIKVVASLPRNFGSGRAQRQRRVLALLLFQTQKSGVNLGSGSPDSTASNPSLDRYLIMREAMAVCAMASSGFIFPVDKEVSSLVRSHTSILQNFSPGIHTELHYYGQSPTRLSYGIPSLNQGSLPPNTSSEFLQKALSLAAENACIADDCHATSCNPEERELLERCSHPSLKVEQLLDIFESHPWYLENPTYQHLLQTQLLQDEVLWSRLCQEPKLAGRLIDVVKSLETYVFKDILVSKSEKKHAAVFLTGLTHRVLLYLKERDKTTPAPPELAVLQKELLDRGESQLNQLEQAAKHEKTNWVKSMLLFGWVTWRSQNTPDVRPYCPQMIQALCEAQACLERDLSNQETREASQLITEIDEAEARRSVFSLRQEIKQYLDTLGSGQREQLFNQLIGFWNLPSPAEGGWKISAFPYAECQEDASQTSYELNLLTGLVTVSGERPGSSRPKRKGADFWRVFGSDTGVVFQERGKASFLCTFKGNQFSMKGEAISLIHQNQEFPLAPESAFSTLPADLRSSCVHFLNPLPGSPALLIYRSPAGKMIAFVDEHGMIHRSRDSAADADLTYMDPSTIQELDHVRPFIQRHCLTWGNSVSVEMIESAHLSDRETHPLRFDRVKDKLCWRGDPTYFIASNQSLPTLRGYQDYLVLENDKKERVVILPLSPLKQSGPSRTTLFDVIPLSQTGALKPQSMEQSLHVAWIQATLGDFASSAKYLSQADTSQTYSPRDLAILQSLIENRRTDPWACVTRLYAAQIALDNIARGKSLNETVPTTLSSFFSEKIWKIINNDLQNFVTNRNVPEGYEPVRLLGRDRLLRLLSELEKRTHAPEDKEPLVTPDPAVMAYYWEIAQQRLSPSEGQTQPRLDLALPNHSKYFKPVRIGYDDIKEGLFPLPPEKHEQLVQSELLTRPGGTFRSLFRDYYSQALSKDRWVRNRLRNRLASMPSEGKNRDVDGALCAYFLAILDAQDHPWRYFIFLYKLPKLPTTVSKEEGVRFFREFREALEWYSPATQYQSRYLGVTPPKQVTPLASIEPRRSFSSVNGAQAGPIFDRQLIDGSVEQPKPEAVPLSLLTTSDRTLVEKEQPFVQRKLQELDEIVAGAQTPEEPHYTLNPSVPLSQIIGQCQQVVQESTDALRKTKIEILNLANGCSIDPLEPDEALLQLSLKKEPWTLESCFEVFLRGDWSEFSKKNALSAEAIDRLHGLIVIYLVTSIKKQKAEEAQKLAEELAAPRSQDLPTTQSSEILPSQPPPMPSVQPSPILSRTPALEGSVPLRKRRPLKESLPPATRKKRPIEQQPMTLSLSQAGPEAMQEDSLLTTPVDTSSSLLSKKSHLGGPRSRPAARTGRERPEAMQDESLLTTPVGASHSHIKRLHSEGLSPPTAKRQKEQDMEALPTENRERLQKIQAELRLRTEKEQRLGELLHAQRAFDANENPVLLLFEYASGKILRPLQAGMLSQMTAEQQGELVSIIVQAIMGFGKSKVIGPILAQYKADGTHCSFLIGPESLFEVNVSDIEQMQRSLFNKSVRQLHFSRDDKDNLDYLCTVRTMLEEAITHREVIVSTPRDILCLDLAHAELRKAIDQVSNGKKRDDLLLKAAQLRAILRLIEHQGLFTFDEAHDILHPKRYVSFTTGESQPPSREDVETLHHLYRHIVSDESLRNVVRLHENNSHLMTDEQWIKVRERLATLMVQEALVMAPDLLKNSPFQAKDLCDYVSGVKRQDVYEHLKKLYEGTDLHQRKAIRHLGLVKHELEGLLLETLRKNAHTHFGLSKKHPEIGVAIPFKANNTPSEGSQYADPIETMNKTYQTLLSGWNSPEQTKAFILYCRERVEKQRILGDVSSAESCLRAFATATGYDLFDPRLLEIPKVLREATKHIHVAIRAATPDKEIFRLLGEYIEDVPLQRQLLIFSRQLNGTTQDLQRFPLSGQGYTGTPGSPDMYALRCLSNPDTDRQVIRALLLQHTPVVKVDSEEPAAVLHSLLGKTKSADEVTAFIDVGALFKGRSNQEVAVGMASVLFQRKDGYQGVLFWNDMTNTLTLLTYRGSTWATTAVAGSSPQEIAAACRKASIDPKKVFTYYDERHTIGADLEYEVERKAFVTASMLTPKDPLLQGAMRMRRLLTGDHREVLVLHRDEYGMVQQVFHLSEEEPLDVHHVVLQASKEQAKKELRDNYDATRQMILATARKWVRSQVLDAATEKEAQKLSVVMRDLMETGSSQDPFVDFGAIAIDQSTETVLYRYADWVLQQMKQSAAKNRTSFVGIDQLSENLAAIIKAQVGKGCLPDVVPGSGNSAAGPMGQEMVQEVSLQQHQQKELSQEQERETFSVPGKAGAATPHPWNVNIFDRHFFLEGAESRHRPSIVPFQAMLKDLGCGGEVSAIVDQRILVTGNFLHTLQHKSIDLFHRGQKGVRNVLIVEEQGQTKAVLLSADDAAFFQDKLAGQKREGARCPYRRMWLVHPNGTLIQEGADPWDSNAQSNAKDLILQTTLLSGDSTRINTQLDPLLAHVNQGSEEQIALRRAAFGTLLELVLRRNPVERQRMRGTQAGQRLLVQT